MLNHRGCAAEANKKYHNSELGDDKGLLQRKKDAMEMEKCNVEKESKIYFNGKRKRYLVIFWFLFLLAKTLREVVKKRIFYGQADHKGPRGALGHFPH